MKNIKLHSKSKLQTIIYLTFGKHHQNSPHRLILALKQKINKSVNNQVYLSVSKSRYECCKNIQLLLNNVNIKLESELNMKRKK